MMRTYEIYVCVDCGSGAELDGTGFCAECSGDAWEKIKVVDVEALETLRAAWNEHMKTCPQYVNVPSFEQIRAWMDAPSNTASARPR